MTPHKQADFPITTILCRARRSLHWIDLHIEDWVRLACDPEAERLMPENRKEIAQGKKDLRQIKTLILATIRKI
jgi:hypothetical protein